MSIRKIDKKKQIQTLEIFSQIKNGQELLLVATFKINISNHKVDEIEIKVLNELNNTYKLVSAIEYCGKEFKNKTVFHFLVNLQKVGLNPVHEKVVITPTKLKIDSGQLILSSFNFYDDKTDEETDCKYDPFNSNSYNPETVDGDIILGNP
ncbi:hypothetical protein [Polaribacter sp. Hel1_85]|uniref:hypothetical protein n=1 Tax=Polaribacter sp. Hel1_85 TaxID=1250005 RepID=UPI00052D487E|nr:hypothetical protein [Polaribacter sp. Hel1_85]KGL63266.1 hypothetical protein PHEL85_0300 [Polaribacter sp. Hel1_85]